MRIELLNKAERMEEERERRKRWRATDEPPLAPGAPPPGQVEMQPDSSRLESVGHSAAQAQHVPSAPKLQPSRFVAFEL